MSVVDVLKEFQGIIGALFGVATTLLITKWLESWGKIRFYFNKIDITYFRIDEEGGYLTTESIEKAEYIRVEFDFEVYNGADIVKPIKDIKALIITENNNIETGLFDVDTYKLSAGSARYDTFWHINLRPKEVQGYRLRFSLSKPDFRDNKVEKITEIYFVAKGINNRTIKKMIYRE